jgi:cob(I)alamin adenosyltransferase
VKIYTRTGDSGETSLLGGRRVSKNDPRIEAYGTVDELSSFIGVARSSWPSSPIDQQLAAVQNDLFDVGASLAALDAARFPGAAENRIEDLEQAIDAMEAELPALTNFILPGGSAAAANLHVARTVCRRAERLVVSIGEGQERTIRYLNRLSDYLFVAARFANAKQGIADVVWKKT